MSVSVGWFPLIRLTDEEQARYDETVASVLRNAITEFSRFNGHIDTDEWALVRKRDQMSVYRSLLGGSSDPVSSTLMVGTGLIPGTLEDVMDGIYCETTAELCAVKTFLNYKLMDGAVLSVNERRTSEAPFRFAGIKWTAVKLPWGMDKNRDLLTYERMGTTVDANGNPLAFHVIQSIEHAKWPVDSVKGVKRESTSTCYLYRRHNNRVQCFLWAQVEDANSVSKRLAEYVVAGNLLNVVYSAECAEAKKCTTLIDTSVPKTWSSTAACHVCFKGPGLLDTNRTCAGCSQCVCKSCSCFRPVFKIDKKTNKPMEGRFCKLCVAKVISSPSTQTLRQRLNSDPTRRNSLKGKRERSSSEQTTQQQQVVSEAKNVYASREYTDSEMSWRSKSVFMPNGAFKTHHSDGDQSAFTDSALTLEHLSVTDTMLPSESDEPSFYRDLCDSSFVSDSSFGSSSYGSSSFSSSTGFSTRRQSQSSSLIDDEIWTTAALNGFDLGTLRLSDSSTSTRNSKRGKSHHVHQRWLESEF